jgi:hypothetical protein
MSLFLDVLACMFIVIGTVGSAFALVTLTNGHAVYKRVGPGARSKAREKLRRSLFVIAAGVCLLAIQSKNDTAEWLAAAAITAIVVWDLGSWLKSRTRRKSGHPTAEPS